MSEHASPGYTLVELASVLVLLAVGASVVAPGARKLADRTAVTGAREEVVRAIARGRAAAIGSVGSSVTVGRSPPRVRVSAAGRSVEERPIGDDGLIVELSGGRDSLTLRFDGLGIGRFANGTVRLRRGDAEAVLSVSSYGRVRRR